MTAKKESKIGLKADPWYPWGPFEKWGKMEFSAFITRMIDEHPGYLSNIYERYIPFGSNVLVGKQENLQSDFISLMNRFYGHNFSSNQILSTKINVSKIKKPLWKAEQKNEIVRLEYAVYRRFNYMIPNDG